MRKHRIFLIPVLLSLSSLAFSAAPSALKPSDAPSVVKAVMTHAKREAADCSVAPLDVKPVLAPDRSSFAVAYGVEGCGGGNNWGVMLASARKSPSGKWIIETSSPPDGGVVDSLSYDGPERLRVSMTVYADDDPRCCPSKKVVLSAPLPGYGWDAVLESSLASKNCVESDRFFSWASKVLVPGGIDVEPKPGVSALPLAEGSRIFVLNRGDHSLARVSPDAARIHGMPVVEVEVARGNDNGIAFHSALLDVPFDAARAVLSSRGRPLAAAKLSRDGGRRLLHVEQSDDFPVSLSLVEERGKTRLVCDYSN